MAVVVAVVAVATQSLVERKVEHSLALAFPPFDLIQPRPASSLRLNRHQSTLDDTLGDDTRSHANDAGQEWVSTSSLLS